MLNTIISIAIIAFGLNYYFKYQNLKKQINYGNNPITNLHNSNAHLGSNITT